MCLYSVKKLPRDKKSPSFTSVASFEFHETSATTCMFGNQPFVVFLREEGTGFMTAPPARRLLHNHIDFHPSKSRGRSNKVKKVAFFCRGANRGLNTTRSTA